MLAHTQSHVQVRQYVDVSHQKKFILLYQDDFHRAGLTKHSDRVTHGTGLGSKMNDS